MKLEELEDELGTTDDDEMGAWLTGLTVLLGSLDRVMLEALFFADIAAAELFGVAIGAGGTATNSLAGMDEAFAAL